MAVLAQGTLLQFESTTPNTWITIANVQNIGGPDMSKGSIDNTDLNSPGHFLRKLPGFIDAGTIPFTITFDPDNSTHDHEAGVLSHFLSNKIYKYRILWPTAALDADKAKCIVNGFPSGFALGGMEVDGKLSADVEITIDGEVDFEGSA